MRRVRKGELVTLLGPSGCGKTTLLRLTAGLIAPDEGRITIAGTPVTGAAQGRLHGVPEFRPAAVAHRHGQRRVSARDRRRRRRRAPRCWRATSSSWSGLAAFAEHYPHELSGGMQQRVGIARALMRKPILIFMDEPFGALDAQTREQLQEDFLAIWSRTGATVVFVTHSIDEALHPLRPHLRVRHRARAASADRRIAGCRRASQRRRPHASGVRQMPRRVAQHAQERAMIRQSDTPPARVLPAPQPTSAQRLRDVLLSPNAIRTASVAVFFVIWEYYGRRMDPIFMAPPSAIFAAARQLIQSGALREGADCRLCGRSRSAWRSPSSSASRSASPWRSGAHWNTCSTPSSMRSTPSRASRSCR